MKRRLLAATVVATALLLGAPTAASAVEYPSSVIPVTATAGAIITYTSAVTGQAVGAAASVSLSGDDAAAQASITLASTLTRTFAVGADGRIAVKIGLPASAATGSKYTLVASSGTFVETRVISVVGLPSDVAAVTLPVTGSDPTTVVWFGSGLLALGAAFVSIMIVRRRNRVAAE